MNCAGLWRKSQFCRLYNFPFIYRHKLRLKNPSLTLSVELSSRNLFIKPKYFNAHVVNYSTKLFIENENDYAHSIMEKRPNYNGYLAQLDSDENVLNEKLKGSQEIDWKTENEITPENFGSWTKLLNTPARDEVYEEQFIKTCHVLSNHTPKLNDQQIETVLKILSQFSLNILDADLHRLWTCVDDICVRRLPTWDVQKSLRIADYFFMLKVSRISKYNSAVIRHWVKDVSVLKCNELVQLLFLINLQRSLDSNAMTRLEKCLSNCLSRLSSEEIVIAAMAFFKTQNIVHSESLFNDILNRFITEVPVLPSLAISTYGKFFRYNSRPSSFEQLGKVFDHCVPFVDKWHPAACLNVALITTKTLVDHEKFVGAVTHTLLNNLKDIRLKELGSLLACLSVFNYEFDSTPDVYLAIAQELRTSKRQQELLLYPSQLVSSLLNLAYRGIFPEDLLKQVFETSYQQQVIDKTKYSKSREYFVLACTLQIEVPSCNVFDWSTDLLKWRPDGARIPQSTDENLSLHEKLLLDIRRRTERILGGSGTCAISQTLSHFQLPDVQVHLNGSQTAVVSNKVPASVQENRTCIVVGGRSCYARNTNKPLGHNIMKNRQLQRLGYQVIEVPYFEYMRVPKEEKYNYIEMKLNQSDRTRGNKQLN